MFVKYLLFLLPLISAASLLDRFENWVSLFKVHFRDEVHFLEMYKTWSSNDKFIEETNSKNLTFQLGHNQFSGMDENQFRQYLGYFSELKSDVAHEPQQIVELTALPNSVDWNERGAVTGVKDQGQCGSCWSFSTTGALEGAYFNKYGILESFSEQQLVDCDTLRNGGRDHGCKGGLMDNAFSWIQKNGGLCEEEAYPYVSGETKDADTCQTKCSVVSKSKITSIVDVTPSSENAFMTALSKQPLAIAIEADQREFQLYKSGVFTGTCGTKLDHGVLAVGYGTLNGADYYLVKNSWSEAWGANGFIMLGRGSEYNNGDGQCGLLLQASYPIV